MQYSPIAVVDVLRGILLRHYESECTVCRSETQIAFSTEPYPEYGDRFRHFCPICETETEHSRTLTKKTTAQLRGNQEEQERREEIMDLCEKEGFSCHFLRQSVIITTDLSDWCFDYQQSKITLYHESTSKINFAAGNYTKAHVQFRNRKMTIPEVIDYIDGHDRWRKESENKIYKAEKSSCRSDQMPLLYDGFLYSNSDYLQMCKGTKYFANILAFNKF